MTVHSVSGAVCVLGMMRTGTSVTSGILDLLGVSFGAYESHLVANRANPTGFQEHREIIALNDALLARLGGTWFSPPALEPGWETSPALADLSDRARTLLESELARADRWGWKDPRTCLTLRFWQRLVSELTYVVCVRRPMDAARSLLALPWARERLRAKSPLEHALELWTLFTVRALESTEGSPRTVVFYDDLVEDPARHSERLADFLGLSSTVDDRVLATIEAFVESRLRHFRGTEEPGERGLSATRALDLYQNLEREYHGGE